MNPAQVSSLVSHVHFTPTYASWLNQVEIWVSPHHPASHSPRNFPQRERTGRENRFLRAILQRQPTPFRLDGNGGLDLRGTQSKLGQYVPAKACPGEIHGTLYGTPKKNDLVKP